MAAEERNPKKEVIQLFLPRSFHAKSKYEPAQDLILITPFGARKGNMSVIDAIVTDADGVELRYQLMLNRKTGMMKCQRLGEEGEEEEEDNSPPVKAEGDGEKKP